VRADCAVAGFESGVRRKVFGCIRLGAAWLSRVVKFGGVQRYEIGCVELGPTFGERVLDRLVLPDLAAEYDTLAGVGDCFFQRPASNADDLGSIKNAFRI
jgi:hypothetical protein